MAEHGAGGLPTLPVTVLIPVRNEAANIDRCLDALAPARRVIVIDSNSTDTTAVQAKAKGAEVLQFAYQGGYPKKRQWAMDHAGITTDWVLLVDADEVIPDTLWNEIAAAIDDAQAYDAYVITKGFHFLGRRFRFGGFSHSAVLLFRGGKARFEELDASVRTAHDMEVHERMIVTGRVGRLATPLIHCDFKGLTAYIDRHNQYSSWEAGVRYRSLRTGSYGDATINPRLFGNTQERRRFLKHIAMRVPFEPLAWFAYHYILRLGFLEGRRGLIACQIRADYIRQARAKLYELALRADSRTDFH